MNGHNSTNGQFTGPVPLWIAGKEVTTSTTFDVASPANSETLWKSSSISPKQAIEAVEAAQNALKTWRKAKPAEIRRIFLKAADVMEKRSDEIAGYMKQETGALDNFAQFNLMTTIENFRDIAGRPAMVMGAIPQTATAGQSAFVFKEPYGVNFGIAPWNAPLILGCRAFLYAVAAGKVRLAAILTNGVS